MLALHPTPVMRRFGWACGNLGTPRGKTLLLSGDMRRESSIASQCSRPSSYVFNVDVIVTSGPIPTRAAKEATTTIPIVMGQDPDPVGNGFVVSLARPGGNITGLSTLAPELNGKRFELLKEVIPKLSRVAVFATSIYPGYAQSLKEVEGAAKGFAVK